jgi:hypothetical protein
MRAFALLLLVALPAHADLYRWVDPQTGRVMLSNLPPTNPAINAEVVPYRGAAGAPLEPQPAAAKADTGIVAALEARWRALLAELSVLPERADFERGGDGIRKQLEAYEATRTELDRLDPAGAKRRQADSASLLERLSKLLER